MGWFEEQVKKRKSLDEKTFEDSFLSLAGLKVDNKKNLSDEEIRDTFVIHQILSYFRCQNIDIPKGITSFNDKLNYVLSQCDIYYHKVELNESYNNEDGTPLLFFTFLSEVPVVLFPKKDKYYYINYSTGKKEYIEAALVNKFELEALSFYRPLPNTKVGIKEYWKYLRKSIRPLDLLFLALFSALATGIGMILPYLTRWLTGNVVSSQDMKLFILVSIYVVSTATGLLLANAMQSYVNNRISLRIEKEVQKAAMMKVLSLPTSFFKKYNTGELAARFASISSLANMIVSSVLTTLITVVMSLAYLFQLISFAPVLILPVALILIISSSFTITISFIQKKYTEKNLRLSSKEAGVTYEMINGIQKIRLSGSEKRVFAKWANAYARAAKIQYQPPMILRLSTTISLFITLLGNIAIYYLAAKNNVTASNYMAFTSSYGVLTGAFTSLVSMVGIFTMISPVYNMARPILETQAETSQGKIHLEGVKGNIKLDNVTFKYLESGPLILDNLSLNIKQGEYIAIVGQTGCGKSTLVRILLGFEKPLEGKVYFDDIDIDKVDLTSLRRNIGTVMQNGTLFHADIFSNIIISSPSLTEEDAWKAAEIADIAKDIREMPMGMKTVISEGQGGISGGQKQRIMIARAIVHKPKILIFDEATSALDNKTQKSITESIDKLNCTRIVIAHRLSTIMKADRIIMLEGGKIIEEGNYETLIAKKGKFAELVERQRLDNNA
ncbi:MAG: ATP-binding cassette domain-containing protein [Bacilli bacterium]|nr:ATP-binding cassette domain-containing protein [Bacilli bacterium]